MDDNTTAYGFLQSNEPLVLLREIDNMINLDFQVADALISLGYDLDVGVSIASFRKDQHEKILDSFIEKGDIDPIALAVPNIDEDVRTSILPKLLKSVDPQSFLLALQFFEPIDDFVRLEIARDLISRDPPLSVDELNIKLCPYREERYDFGTRGNIPLTATCASRPIFTMTAEGTLGYRVDSELTILAGNAKFKGKNPDETLDLISHVAANGFESWRGKTPNTQRSLQNDFQTALTELKGLVGRYLA